ncbi:MAG: hypothetical protein ACXVFV_12765 [Mycobacteriales bacterium]
MLVLAVAGGAWVLFGREGENGTTAAIGPAVSTTAPATKVIGPVAPTAVRTPAVRATSVRPVGPAVPSAAPTSAAPAKAPAPTKAAAKPAVPAKAAPAGAAQQGTVAQRAYTFRVTRGDTLWGYTLQVLRDTGRSTADASVASFVGVLYAHNSGVIGSDPNLIVPGQTITWPAGV